MSIYEQVKLYILSLMFLFLVVFIISFNFEPIMLSIEYRKFCYSIFYDNWLPILMLLILVYCNQVRREFNHKLAGNASDSLKVKSCNKEDYEPLTFLATYIIPFFGFSFDSPNRLLAYFVLIVVIGVMFIRTEKYYANPTLSILGFKLYRADLVDGEQEYKSVVVITKDKIIEGQTISYKFISENVCFARNVKNEI